MGKYIFRRLLQTLIILLGVTVLVFVLVNLIPGNPYYSMFPPETPTEQIEAMLRDLGYYDPLAVKYFKWAGRAIQGDFGYSIFYKQPVMKVIASRLGNTVLLSLTAIVLSTILGISLGIFTARRRNGAVDAAASVTSFILLSMPVFFLGMLMIKIFAVNLRLFPISGMVTVHRNYRGLEKTMDVIHHMVLPALILGLYYAVTMFRYTRSSVFDVLRADYIRAARAHGIPERVVLYRHTLKNAMIPIVTVLSLQIPSLLSGALITETVFLWPGVGRLSYEAVNHRDYPLVMGILLIMACITLVSNLTADITYAAIDQRITFDDSQTIR